MPRGGIRPRADGSLAHLIQPKWKLGQTKTIRVPVALADELLEIAHCLDEGSNAAPQDNLNGIDLSQDLGKIKAERDQLDRELDALHSKNGDLHLEIATLRDELSQLAGKTEPETLLKAARKFIELKRLGWGSNPAQRGEFSTASRSWDMFRQFVELAENSPEELLGDD